MSEISIRQSTDYEVQQLTVLTNYGQIDVAGLFIELNLFDSLLQPCLSGNILIEDANGLASKMQLDGSECLIVQMSKVEDVLPYYKKYHIYKMTDRKNTGLSKETFVLHFASEELMESAQNTIEIGYQDTYSEVVRSALEDYLNISSEKKQGILELSTGTNSVNPPVLKPFELTNWCAKRALDFNGLPTFFFFENIDGYNFVSTSTMFKNESLFTVDFSIRNTKDDLNNANLFTARGYEVVSQYDVLKSTQAGVYAGTFVGYDTMTRQVMKKKIDFSQIYGEGAHANKYKLGTNYVNRTNNVTTEMFNSRRVVYPFAMYRPSTPWLSVTDGGESNLKDNPEKWYFQRKAVVHNLTSRRIKVVLPGNFQLSSGYCLNVAMPLRGQKAENDTDDNLDTSVGGKYLILATRHIIKYDRHETIVELVADSSPQQSKAIETEIASEEPVQESGQEAE